jgi:hypothetical protein
MTYQSIQISIYVTSLAIGWQKMQNKWQGRTSRKPALSYGNRVTITGQLELAHQIARFGQPQRDGGPAASFSRAGCA